MVQQTWVLTQVASYQRLLKWYLIPPCFTLSIIRYVSRVKWSNPGKEVAPSSTPQCSSYWIGSLLVALDYGRQLYYLLYLLLLYQLQYPINNPTGRVHPDIHNSHGKDETKFRLALCIHFQDQNERKNNCHKNIPTIQKPLRDF